MSGSDHVLNLIVDDPFEPRTGKVLLEARRGCSGSRNDGSDGEGSGPTREPCPTDPHPNLWGMRINLGTTHGL